jgi:hypothetical protein
MTFSPTLIQIILSVIACSAAERVISRLRVRRMGAMFGFAWLAGIAGFLFFVWRPDYATRVSQIIGVGRGVDAALYISVALLFYVVLRILIRLEHQDDTITRLVSEIALLSASSVTEKKESSDSSPQV